MIRSALCRVYLLILSAVAPQSLNANASARTINLPTIGCCTDEWGCDYNATLQCQVQPWCDASLSVAHKQEHSLRYNQKRLSWTKAARGRCGATQISQTRSCSIFPPPISTVLYVPIVRLFVLRVHLLGVEQDCLSWCGDQFQPRS